MRQRFAPGGAERLRIERELLAITRSVHGAIGLEIDDFVALVCLEEEIDLTVNHDVIHAHRKRHLVLDGFRTRHHALHKIARVKAHEHHHIDSGTLFAREKSAFLQRVEAAHDGRPILNLQRQPRR